MQSLVFGSRILLTKSFWSEQRFNPIEAKKLEGVKGFITLLPIEWTKGENNNHKYNPRLVTMLTTKEKEKMQQINANPLSLPTQNA